MQYVRFPHKYTGYHISQSLETILVFMIMLDKSRDKRYLFVSFSFSLESPFPLAFTGVSVYFLYSMFLSSSSNVATLLLILQSLIEATAPSLMASINPFSWCGKEGRMKAMVEIDNLTEWKIRTKTGPVKEKIYN